MARLKACPTHPSERVEIGDTCVRCDAMRRRERNEYKVFNKSVDYRFYSSERWKKVSKYIRSINPLCVICKSNGVVRGSQCVDHITPISEDGDKFDLSNLQAICTPCHTAKTRRERGYNGDHAKNKRPE